MKCYGDHRDLHVLTHSLPTRRSSDLYPPSSVALTSRRATEPVRILNGTGTQGETAAATRAGSATRQAMVAAQNSTSDAIRNTATRCGKHAWGPTEQEYTAPKNSGERTTAIGPKLQWAHRSGACAASAQRRV